MSRPIVVVVDEPVRLRPRGDHRFAGTSLAGGPRPARTGRPSCPGGAVVTTASVVGSTLVALGSVGQPPGAANAIARTLRRHDAQVEVTAPSVATTRSLLAGAGGLPVRVTSVTLDWGADDTGGITLLRLLERSDNLDLSIGDLDFPALRLADVRVRRRGRGVRVDATVLHGRLSLGGLRDGRRGGPALAPVALHGPGVRFARIGQAQPGAVVHAAQGGVVATPAGTLHGLVTSRIFHDPHVAIDAINSTVAADGALVVTVLGRLR